MPIFPCILNNSLIRIPWLVSWKTLFHAFSPRSHFIPPEIIEVTVGFLMFSILLTHFSSVFLFYTQKTLGRLLFPGGIRSEHWEEMSEIISYYMLIFTQFKKSIFQEVTFMNCFGIFKWIHCKRIPFILGTRCS